MISKEEVKKIAKLARLGLKDQELEKYQKELSSVLDYIEKLKEVDFSKIKPTSHPNKAFNMMRKDEATKSSNQKKLLDQAPEEKDNYIKVKSIFNG